MNLEFIVHGKVKSNTSNALGQQAQTAPGTSLGQTRHTVTLALSKGTENLCLAK